ncbi:MAG: hypothetical protein HC842_02725 [Cytophagales bacterium]|nr:hypothetical protein [Cytophagales bacterium]
MTKLFTDRLDNYSEPSDTRPGAQSYLDDWLYFVGLTYQYTFYRIPCPYDYRFP